MTIIFVGLVMGFIGWKLGRKWQDFSDLMLARRVAKLVDQRERFVKENEKYAQWERQDSRIGETSKRIEEEIG